VFEIQSRAPAVAGSWRSDDSAPSPDSAGPAAADSILERPRTGIVLDVPSTEAVLRAAWETWVVDRRHAVAAAVLPAVVARPTRRGKRFSLGFS
jgi:hypothetical protein